MLRRVKQVAIAVIAMAAIAAPASAATVIDFATGLSGVGGAVWGVGTDVIGENIPIGNTTISGAPMGNGDYTVRGTATSTNLGGWGDLDFNTAAGTFSLSGCIPGIVGAAAGAMSCSSIETLMSGTITSFSNVNNASIITVVFGVDTKNAALMNFIGLDPSTQWTLTGSVNTGTPFGMGRANALPSVSTDFANAANPTVIPEPATMVLMGTGLLAALRARRRTT